MVFESLPITNLNNNQYISLILTVLLILYASFLGPNVNPFIKSLFNNTIFKIIVLFLLVVRGNNNPLLSIVTVIAFVLTLNYISLDKSTEKFTNTRKNALN